MVGVGIRPFCAGARAGRKERKMSKKVIDVSSYQGLVNWVKVKAAGIQGAILKIIRKDLNRITSLRPTGPDVRKPGCLS